MTDQITNDGRISFGCVVGDEEVPGTLLLYDDAEGEPILQDHDFGAYLLPNKPGETMKLTEWYHGIYV